MVVGREFSFGKNFFFVFFPFFVCVNVCVNVCVASITAVGALK